MLTNLYHVISVKLRFLPQLVLLSEKKIRVQCNEYIGNTFKVILLFFPRLLAGGVAVYFSG